MRSLFSRQIVAPFEKTNVVLSNGNEVRGPRLSGGIFRIYGWTGVLMVVAFLLSGAWTLALAVVQVAPSAVANYLMGTAQLDFGDFWTLQKADDSLAVSAAVLLVVFAIGYFSLVVKMVRLSTTLRGLTIQRRRVIEVHPVGGPSHVHAQDESGEVKAPGRETSPDTSGWWQRLWRWFRGCLTRAMKSQDIPELALPKLLLQTTVLIQYLHEGLPPTTIFLYASLLVLNWMISMYCTIFQLVDPRAALTRVFYSLCTASSGRVRIQVFIFDSAEFATRTEFLNSGNFEVVARLFADPAEVSLFRAAFCSLQLSSLFSLGVKVVLNVFAIRKWSRTIWLLSEHEHSHSPTSTQLQRPGLRGHILAVVCFAMGMGVFVYSVTAVVSSTTVCKRFAQCKVPSYRWNVGWQQCSCSVFVDRQTEVKTFDEWENPIDTTANLAALAASGDLKVVQIVNRQLPTLPDELRRCSGLHQLILLYTKTITIPDWAREFTQLEYLHIEGDRTEKQLQSLPRDLFVDMPKLAFLHLGGLLKIPFVPDLGRLRHLKYLTLAMLHSVTIYPGLDKLESLERVNIINAIHVSMLPSLARLTNLKSVVIAGRNELCCNGFWDGNRDLSKYACQDRTSRGEPLVECTHNHISSCDREVLNVVGNPACDQTYSFDLADQYVTRTTTDFACGGVKYKQCELGGVPGICFPSRMMAITCEQYAPFEALRRLQIERGVGDSCDPIVEQWLECHAS